MLSNPSLIPTSPFIRDSSLDRENQVQMWRRCPKGVEASSNPQKYQDLFSFDKWNNYTEKKTDTSGIPWAFSPFPSFTPYNKARYESRKRRKRKRFHSEGQWFPSFPSFPSFPRFIPGHGQVTNWTWLVTWELFRSFPMGYDNETKTWWNLTSGQDDELMIPLSWFSAGNSPIRR